MEIRTGRVPAPSLSAGLGVNSVASQPQYVTGSAPGDAFSVAVKLHHLAAERNMDRHLDGIREGLRLGPRQYLSTLGCDFIRVRWDYGSGLDQIVDHICCFHGTGGEGIADIQVGELCLVVAAHDGILLARNTRISVLIDTDAVAASQHIYGSHAI